jgi:hypothetical protein
VTKDPERDWMFPELGEEMFPELGDAQTVKVWQDAVAGRDVVALPKSPEELERLRELARAARPRPAPFQVVYGRLNLQGHRHEIVWTLQRPFRANDLSFWGHSEGTVIERFAIGDLDDEDSDQLVQEAPVSLVFRDPLPFQRALDSLAELPRGGDLAGVRTKERIPPSSHGGMTFATGHAGAKMLLRLRGPLAHVFVVGDSVE